MTDIDALINPPKTIIVAVWLLVLSYILGYTRFLITKGWFTSVVSVLATLLFFALVYVITRALYKGRNWVRWLFVAFITAGILYLPWSLAGIAVPWERGVYLAQGVMQFIAAILLVLPGSNRWYRPNPSFKRDA